MHRRRIHSPRSIPEWFLQEKNNGNRVIRLMMQKKALEINKNLNGFESFKASAGFLQKLKERNNINLSFRTGYKKKMNRNTWIKNRSITVRNKNDK